MDINNQQTNGKAGSTHIESLPMAGVPTYAPKIYQKLGQERILRSYIESLRNIYSDLTNQEVDLTFAGMDSNNRAGVQRRCAELFEKEAATYQAANVPCPMPLTIMAKEFRAQAFQYEEDAHEMRRFRSIAESLGDNVWASICKAKSLLGDEPCT